MQMLARREHSRAELREKLLPHAAEGEDVEALLDLLAAKGWLSDARAVEQLISHKRGRFGSQRILYELQQKGVSEALVEAYKPRLKEGEFEAARVVWQKKFGAPPRDAKDRARQMRFMQSRGFSAETVFNVLKSAGFEDDGED